jgi:UDP-N-acetylmuramoyl-tripeptide--D-alanyl-D-alanine ligase
MKIWSATDLTECLGVNTKASGNVVHFNSSDLSAGDVFIALGNGHNYINEAVKRGASCIIAENAPGDVDHDKVIVVANTNDALLKMARYKRVKSKAKFIGVTGSAGKTSTKEMLAQMLQGFGKTFVSRGNFNNHLGVPLNLASMPDDAEYVVCEMGMNHKGEIRPLAALVRPEIAVITNVLAVHIEHFSSVQEIADEKCEIFSSMDSDGIAILNADNPYYEYCRKIIKTKNIHSFGSDDNADIYLTDYESDGFEAKMKFMIEGRGLSLTSGLVGRHHAGNIASVLLIAYLLKLDLNKAVAYLENILPVEGRGQKIKVTINKHECVLIDDSYNASPSSMQCSLIAMRDIASLQKIAILADMKELGDNAIEYHKDLAEFVLGAGVENLYTVGALMRNLHNELKSKIDCQHFDSIIALERDIISLIKEPSVILLKGSNSMNLSYIVEFLTNKNGITHVV